MSTRIVYADCCADGTGAAHISRTSASESFIFKDTVFFLEENTPDASDLANLLETHGARRAVLPADWTCLTHVIAGDLSGEVAHSAQKRGIPVVNTEWVKASVRRRHQQNIKYFSADPRHFLTGIVVLCVELPCGDREAIYEGVLALGGQCTKILSKNVTHIITLHINHDICKQVMRRPDLGIRIMLPQWLEFCVVFAEFYEIRYDDCLKEGRRVEETPYMFPSLSILEREGTNGASDALSCRDRADNVKEGLEDHSRRTKQILRFKKILFSNDLEIGQRLRRTLEIVAVDFGATIVSSVLDANVFIGMYREGEYIEAVSRGIIVGNLTWFYWMLVYRTWVRPEKNLLHYPVVRGGLPEMREMIITISNYQGESRQYLEKLIEALGATFTKNMKPINTHLIIPCKSGQKYMAALEWNICIVNHLWIEETYAKWKLQSITTPRYIYFSSQTNLMETVGNTPIDMNIIEFHYGKACDSITVKKSPFKESNLLDYSSNSLDNEEVSQDFPSIPLNIHSASKNFASLHINNDSQLSFLNSECDSPVKENLPSFHRRKAAVMALEKLHNEIMPDILLYQKECKRKTAFDQSTDVKNVRKKSKELFVDHENKKNDTPSVDRTPKAKSSTLNKVSQDYDIRILVTGYNDWNNQIEKALFALGIATVQDPKNCTHLITSRIQRTQKFLSALAYAPKVLSINWIKMCIKEKKIIDESNYFLFDPQSEMKYNFKLVESLKRASENKHSLFKGYLFQISPGAVSNYNNGIDTVKQIIEANGGVCVSTTSRRNEIEYEGFLVVLISNNLNDRASKNFIEKCKKTNQVPLIYNMEWVLTTVLRQELKFTDENCLLKK
ncbi:hypothetical protein PMAC_002818 [Pneumocystis sp. 'macacae']|nr:hypothetical protein PMAC_002818 [Pneumocystis sp. 'macacae']